MKCIEIEAVGPDVFTILETDNDTTARTNGMNLAKHIVKTKRGDYDHHVAHLLAAAELELQREEATSS